MARPLSFKELEARVRALLAAPLEPGALLAELEPLRREWLFAGMTWLFGPVLYRRDRIRFRPFVLANWGFWARSARLGGNPWRGDVGRDLAAWLQEAEALEDVEVARRLLEQKHAGTRHERDSLLAELQQRLAAATSPARLRLALETCDVFSLQLTEDLACDLYRRAPRLAPAFVLRHLPWTGSSGRRGVLWERLREDALRAGDRDFADRLYRLQAPLPRWREDALALADRVRDPDLLCAELARIHPEAVWRDLGDAFVDLLERRGRDVMPYVQQHLSGVLAQTFFRGSYRRLLALASERGWHDFRAAVVRACGTPADFSREVRALLDDRSLAEATVRERLLQLTGLAREWNFGPFGFASIRQLEDATAVRLHERFPDLVRGPFRANLQAVTWGDGLPRLVARLIAHDRDRPDDRPLLDFLASRHATRGSYGQRAETPDPAVEPLADHYARMKAEDAREFARRSIAVLAQIPAFAVWSFGRVLRTNRLARILFERSLPEYLLEPALLTDLVEAPEIHVQHLAYRVLAQDDPRARSAAVHNLDVLLGTLLRPLHRATRLAAFGALANAAHDPDAAARIAARARQALDLPDARYPKERLLGLLAACLHRHRGLRGAGEEPLVHRRAR